VKFDMFEWAIENRAGCSHHRAAVCRAQ
jgi:hypothetical protein